MWGRRRTDLDSARKAPFFSSFYTHKMKLSVNIVLTVSLLLSSQHLQVQATAPSFMNTSSHLLEPVDASTPTPPSVFPSIQHPFPPVYADPKFKAVVPTSSWISNLFYPSVNNLAPTTPDPYILRLLDGFGGNPGLSISQPHDKVLCSNSFRHA